MRNPIINYTEEAHKRFIDAIDNGIPENAETLPYGNIIVGDLNFEMVLEPISSDERGGENITRYVPVLSVLWANPTNGLSEGVNDKNHPYTGAGVIPYDSFSNDRKEVLDITISMIIDCLKDSEEMWKASNAEPAW